MYFYMIKAGKKYFYEEYYSTLKEDIGYGRYNKPVKLAKIDSSVWQLHKTEPCKNTTVMC